MLNDPRRILLLNRIALIKEGDQKMATSNFATHIHMSWPNFYNAFSQMTPTDANILLFSPHTHYTNDGVLLDIGAILSPNNLLSDLEVPHGSKYVQ